MKWTDPIVVELLERERRMLENTADGRRLREVDAALGRLVDLRPRRYEGLRPLAAARLWLAEEASPRSTTEIANALRARGVQTRSKDFVTSLHATLKNSPAVRRIGRGRAGRWALVESQLADDEKAA